MLWDSVVFIFLYSLESKDIDIRPLVDLGQILDRTLVEGQHGS